jgi:hypothetical protein
VRRDHRAHSPFNGRRCTIQTATILRLVTWKWNCFPQKFQAFHRMKAQWNIMGFFGTAELLEGHTGRSSSSAVCLNQKLDDVSLRKRLLTLHLIKNFGVKATES